MLPAASPLTPDANPQFVPHTSTSAKDCVAATAAHGLQRATADRVRVTHADVRRESGAPSTRGLYLYEAANACEELTGIRPEVVLYASRETLRGTVVGGQACGVTGHTAETRYTSRRTNYYVGPHEIDVLAWSWWPKGEICGCERKTAEAHAEFTVYDPGLTTIPPRQWSAGLVYRFAERLTGANHINLLVFPDTENRPWTASYVASIRSHPGLTWGKKVADTVKGKQYPGERTQKGGRWQRPNGTYGNGWVHIRYTSTKWGWVPGKAVR